MDDRSIITSPLFPSGSTKTADGKNSRYGVISNREWLEKEKERISKSGHRVEIGVVDRGREVLYYLDGYYENGIWRNLF